MYYKLLIAFLCSLVCIHSNKALVQINPQVIDAPAEVFGRLSIAQMEDQQKSEQDIIAQERKRVNALLERKTKDCIELVKKAAVHFKKNSIEVACRDFTRSLAWRKGEIFVYVLDAQGTILCYGDDASVIWKNIGIAGVEQPLAERVASTEQALIERIAKIAKKGGWVNYHWNNGDQFAYALKVVKNGSTYYCLAGFYPESQEYDTKILVDNAVGYLYENGIDKLVAQANNLFGPFVKSAMTLFIYNENGDLLSDPENTGFMGQNLLNIMNQSGSYIIKQGQDIARGDTGEGWFTYPWKNSNLKSYVRRVVDPKTKKSYAITSGYFPDTTSKDVVSFVHKAISHIKSVGAKEAFSDFNNAVGAYVQGPLTIFVYDYEGNNLADGTNPSFVGKNLIERKDAEGVPITQRMIDMTNAYGKGSFSYIERNDYKVRYFEAIEVPDGKFIIGSSYFPSSKIQTVESIVNKGMAYLTQQPITKALNEFNNPKGEYYRGDIYLFVYTLTGTALVNGMQKDLIWRNFSDLADAQGRTIIQDLTELGKTGGGWAQYVSRNAERHIYVQLVTKQDPITQQAVQFIIGSGYYV